MKRPTKKPTAQTPLTIAADPQNPNRMSAEDKNRMAKSLAEFGDLSGIILNRRTGLLIGGHQRVDVLTGGTIETTDLPESEPDGTVARGALVKDGKRYGLRVVDWPEGKAHAALLAANRFGRVGSDDLPLLKDLLEELDTGAMDMDLTGYSLEAIEALMLQEHQDEPEGESIVADKDPRVLVRLSFNPSVWLGARDEILEVCKKMEAKYECQTKVDE